ncbi:hypothetical protein F5I97DRAFT_1805631 [Phlebopus sp. FC_14]|nr:hypothetical protein F5I97DRAFT_1805631 [Phlebopus sp. FC_14]
MRRIASVFAARRDRADAPSSTSSNEDSLPQRGSQKSKGTVFDSLSRKVAHPTLPSLVASELANSSSSSSCGSTTLRTPDDDTLPRLPSKRGNWKSWLGAKKPADHLDEARHHRQPHPTGPTPKGVPHQPKVNPTNDTDDASEDESYHSGGLPHHSSPSKHAASAHTNLRMLITDSLIPHPTSSPLLDLAETTSFPRSCHRSRHLPRQETMESQLHKKVLLIRLDHLSRSEELSIAPFASKVVVTATKALRDPQHDFLPDAGSVTTHSKGLRSWVSRPCYEDRVRVWTRQETGDITCTRVPGSSFGVAALEFSEPLELLADTLPVSDDDALADIGFDPSSELFTLPISEPISDLGSHSSKPSSPPPLPTQSETAPLEPTTVIDEPVPKRGVHFADDGKDDQIPLGYVLRIRKNKEKKARFLRQERERRVMGIERMMREEERRRQEVERQEMAKLQRARELERKRAEEEQQRRAYAEELHASRVRRDAARTGQQRSPSASHTRGSECDRSASRDSIYASPRKINPSQRFAPELILPPSPYNGSPVSSLPATPGSQHSFSRPPSVYSVHTASSEDVRGRDGRKISKRSSTIADPTKQMFLQAPYNSHASLTPYTPPPWPGLPPVPPISPILLGHAPPVVPLVNAMPFYGMDMPLLPPSPPFMNTYGRPRSYNSSQVLPLPGTHSSEAVADGSRSSHSHSNGTHVHHRRPSAEAARVSTSTPTVSRSDSQDHLRTTPSSGRARLAHQQSSPGNTSSPSRFSRPISTAHPPTPTRRRTAAS